MRHANVTSGACLKVLATFARTWVDQRPPRVLASVATESPNRRTASRQPIRSGFTLVELLIVVAILLILVAMTATAIDFAFTGEKLKSGARQVQSALEGARDRAIFAKEPRGLRLLVDADDPRIVTAMVYVGAGRNWSEGLIRLERKDGNGDGTADVYRDTNGDGTADATSVCIVRGDPTCGWYTLKERGFLGTFEDLNLNGVLDSGEDLNSNGLLDLDAPRIKIPADDNGSWYTVLTHLMTPTNQILELLTDYRDPGTTAPNQVVAFQGAGPSTYLLELPPRILPDAQPILLPEGICIDLDGSAVPSAWRPGAGAVLTSPYSSHMDIMFSSRGMATGSIAAAGVIHLYLAETKDVVKTTTLNVFTIPSVPGADPKPRPPINGTMGPIIPGLNQFGPDDSIGDRLLVSLFTQTGKISSHKVDATDTDSNGYADVPFRYVLEGEATSQ